MGIKRIGACACHKAFLLQLRNRSVAGCAVIDYRVTWDFPQFWQGRWCPTFRYCIANSNGDEWSNVYSIRREFRRHDVMRLRKKPQKQPVFHHISQLLVTSVIRFPFLTICWVVLSTGQSCKRSTFFLLFSASAATQKRSNGRFRVQEKMPRRSTIITKTVPMILLRK